ncbi:group II truncated hemoglobin [Sorangium sp. So ce1024]|uniref:group II truncated hemoglobin n=1 Tax=unclassified Sorangium TaxID=2621164 RepID=UPI003F101932
MASAGSQDVAPSVQSVVTGDNPHFAAVGGAPAVARLVDRFYFHMDTLPEAAAIRALHPADLKPVKEVLERYLTEWLGGPALYSAERGHPRLRRRHLRFRIGAAERDAWMLCMRAALADVVSDPALRAQLDAAFYKVADFLRNDAEHAHRRHAATEPRE